MTRSRASGTRGFTSDARVGASRSMAMITSVTEIPSKGRRPVTIS